MTTSGKTEARWTTMNTKSIGSTIVEPQTLENDGSVVDCHWGRVELARMFPQNEIDVPHWFAPTVEIVSLHLANRWVTTSHNSLLANPANDASFSRTAT